MTNKSFKDNSNKNNVITFYISKETEKLLKEVSATKKKNKIRYSSRSSYNILNSIKE